MLKPTFGFDPSSQFTMLQLIGAGAAGALAVDSPVTPVGINRVVFGGHIQHLDVGTTHILELALQSPDGNYFGIPTEMTSAVGASDRVCVTEPFMIPAGWRVRARSLDAVGGAAVISFGLVYLDYLIRV